MVVCGVRWVLVVELSSLGCSVDSLMSQESMLTSVVWPMMYHLCVSESPWAAVVPGCSPMMISRMVELDSVIVSL